MSEALRKEVARYTRLKILQLKTQGIPLKVIAGEVGLSLHTVYYHWVEIRKRIRASSDSWEKGAA